MTTLHTFRRRVAAIAAIACCAQMPAGAAQAVDLRDWGRKYNAASERYVVLASFNNAAVLDKETQLVWQRTPLATTTNWHGALGFCRTSTTGGREGWRLPTITELATLVGTGSVLPAGHPFQNLSEDAYYWSSTEQSSNPTYAYAKRLLTQGNTTPNKSSTYPFLCVRGVGVANPTG